MIGSIAGGSPPPPPPPRRSRSRAPPSVSLIRRPSLAANRAGQKRSPDRRQVLRSGLPTWRVEVTLRPPPRDPLKRDSHTLVRSCFIDKHASWKEKHCDIFATIKAVIPQSKPAKRQLDPPYPLGGHALMPKPSR